MGTSLAASLSAAAPAEAYCPGPQEWNATLIYAGIGNAVPTGWHAAIKASMIQWSTVPDANWVIQWRQASPNITVSYRVPSGGFGFEPGLTRLEINPAGDIVGGDIFLDPAWSWNTNGNLNQANMVADVRTVVTHEFGHETRLRHPNVCSGTFTAAEQAAAMNPAFVQRWAIQPDDKAGVAYMK